MTDETSGGLVLDDGYDFESVDLVLPVMFQVPDHAAWGDEFAQLGMVEAAVEAYERALEQGADGPAIGARLEEVRKRSDSKVSADVVASIRTFAEALAYGHDARKRGRHLSAVAALAVATKLEPKNAIAWCALGAAHRHAADCDAARAAYEESLSLGGGDAAAVGLAAVDRDIGDHEEAARRLAEVLDRNPESCYALNGLGGVYYDMGLNSKAEGCFTRALKARGGSRTATSGLEGLLNTYRAAGDTDAADRVRGWLMDLG